MNITFVFFSLLNVLRFTSLDSNTALLYLLSQRKAEGSQPLSFTISLCEVWATLHSMVHSVYNTTLLEHTCWMRPGIVLLSRKDVILMPLNVLYNANIHLDVNTVNTCATSPIHLLIVDIFSFKREYSIS